MNRNTLSTTCLKDYLTHNNNTTTIKEPPPPPPSSTYAIANNKNNQMAMKKEFWDSHNNNNNNNNGDQDHHHYMNNGFPWPPRSYTCSFCRKEFKSAQALGGHMNVHRRDRARLRQSPPITSSDHNQNHHGHAPILNLNLNHHPSTTTSPSISTSSFSLSSSTLSCASHKKPVVTSTTLPLFFSNPAAPNSTSELKRWVVVDGNILVNPLSTKASEPTKQNKIIEGYDDGSSARVDHGCKILKKKAEILRVDLEIGLPRNYDDLDLELRLGTYS